jgi:hypothetical protein
LAGEDAAAADDEAAAADAAVDRWKAAIISSSSTCGSPLPRFAKVWRDCSQMACGRE